MGLDNSFYLKDRRFDALSVEIAYFRKYYELDDWCMHRCKHIGDYEVELDLPDIEDLLHEVEPIAEALLKLGFNEIAYYDDYGYPKEYQTLFYNKHFNPVPSVSLYAGTKLCNLYFSLCTMREILANDDSKNTYITFYSSF